MEKTPAQIQREKLDEVIRSNAESTARAQLLKEQLELNPGLAEAGTDELQKAILLGAAAQEILFAKQGNPLAIGAAISTQRQLMPAPEQSHEPTLPSPTARIEPVDESPKPSQMQTQPMSYSAHQQTLEVQGTGREPYAPASSFASRFSAANGTNPTNASSSANTSSGRWPSATEHRQHFQQSQRPAYPMQPYSSVSRNEFIPYDHHNRGQAGSSRLPQAYTQPSYPLPSSTINGAPQHQHRPGSSRQKSQSSNPPSNTTNATSSRHSGSYNGHIPNRPVAETQQKRFGSNFYRPAAESQTRPQPAPTQPPPPPVSRPPSTGGQHGSNNFMNFSSSQLPPNAREHGYIVVDPSAINAPPPTNLDARTNEQLMQEFQRQLANWVSSTAIGAKPSPLAESPLYIQRTGVDVARIMLSTRYGPKPASDAEIVEAIRSLIERKFARPNLSAIPQPPLHRKEPLPNPSQTVAQLSASRPGSSVHSQVQEKTSLTPINTHSIPRLSAIPNTIQSDSTASHHPTSTPKDIHQHAPENTKMGPPIPSTTNHISVQSGPSAPTPQTARTMSSSSTSSNARKPVPPLLARNLLRALGVSGKDTKRVGGDETDKEGSLRGSKRQKTISRTASPTEEPATPSTPVSQLIALSVLPTTRLSTMGPAAAENAEMRPASHIPAIPTVSSASEETPKATTAIPTIPLLAAVTSVDTPKTALVDAVVSSSSHSTMEVEAEGSAPVHEQAPASVANPYPYPDTLNQQPANDIRPIPSHVQRPSPAIAQPMITTFINSTPSQRVPVRVSPPRTLPTPQAAQQAPQPIKWAPVVSTSHEVKSASPVPSTSHIIEIPDEQAPPKSRPTPPPVSPTVSEAGPSSHPSFSPKSALFLPSSPSAQSDGMDGLQLQYPDEDVQDEEEVFDMVQRAPRGPSKFFSHVLLPKRPAWVQADMDRRKDITPEGLQAVELALSRLREFHCRWGSCGITLNSSAALRSHVEFHCDIEETAHVECQWLLCTHVSFTADDLRQHLKGKHVSKYSCAFQKCDQVFSSSAKLLAHHQTDHKRGVLRPAATLLTVNAKDLEMHLPTLPETLPAYMNVPLTFRIPGIPKARFVEESQELLRHLMGKPRLPSTRSHRRIPTLMEARSKGTFEYESLHRRSDGNASRFAKIRGLNDLPSVAVSQFLREGKFMYPPRPKAGADEIADEPSENEDPDEIDFLPRPGSAITSY